jgi:hypothetical protein
VRLKSTNPDVVSNQLNQLKRAPTNQTFLCQNGIDKECVDFLRSGHYETYRLGIAEIRPMDFCKFIEIQPGLPDGLFSNKKKQFG